MRTIATLALILLVVATLAAQRPAPAPDSTTQEGQLLQRIADEPNLANRRSLLEEFVATYPDHSATPWAYEQLMDAYRSADDPDKLLAAGERILALDPGDFTTAQTCLNAALQLKKDPDLVLKWTETLSSIVDQLAHSPKPDDENEAQAWETHVNNAKLAESYSESILYEAAQQTQDPYKKIELGEALAIHNPDSEYKVPMAELLFKAYLQTGDTDKALALGKETLAQSPVEVEMLLNLASLYRSRQQPEKALALAKRAIELASHQETPEGMTDASWEPRREELRAFGQYTMGVVYATTGKWADADAQLRDSLQGITSQESKAEALYYLGLANYRLAEKGELQRASDALLFSTQSADIPGHFQELARKNAEAIRAKFQVQ
jgi:Tetratricopeptide repeat